MPLMADNWQVRLICCGREDGIQQFDTWDEAEQFREAYISGPGVGPDGHDRAAVITGTPAPGERLLRSRRFVGRGAEHKRTNGHSGSNEAVS